MAYRTNVHSVQYSVIQHTNNEQAKHTHTQIVILFTFVHICLMKNLKQTNAALVFKLNLSLNDRIGKVFSTYSSWFVQFFSEERKNSNNNNSTTGQRFNQFSIRWYESMFVRFHCRNYSALSRVFDCTSRIRRENNRYSHICWNAHHEQNASNIERMITTISI